MRRWFFFYTPGTRQESRIRLDIAADEMHARHQRRCNCPCIVNGLPRLSRDVLAAPGHRVAIASLQA